MNAAQHATIDVLSVFGLHICAQHTQSVTDVLPVAAPVPVAVTVPADGFCAGAVAAAASAAMWC